MGFLWGGGWGKREGFGGTGFLTQGLTLARQALLPVVPLRQIFFVMGVFKISSCKVFAQAGLEQCLLISASWMARITGVRQWYQARGTFCIPSPRPG
jgi:hypothetical protein